WNNVLVAVKIFDFGHRRGYYTMNGVQTPTTKPCVAAVLHGTMFSSRSKSSILGTAEVIIPRFD
ncbi:MAG: hypothetical protein ACOX6U_04880, partial [Oscillospiraceae bacterium]